MTLKEKLAGDLKAAMKAKETIRLETVRMLSAALKEREIEKRGSGNPVAPEDELAVLASAAKKRKESIDLFWLGVRLDLVEEEEKKLAITQEYLPKQLSEGEIAAVISDAIAQTGAQGGGDFGKVMPLVMKQVKGKSDGKLVQEMVKKALGVV